MTQNDSFSPIGKNADGEWVDPRDIIKTRDAPPSNVPRQIPPECSESPDGKHRGDFDTVTPGRIDREKSSYVLIFNVRCQHCGSFGSFGIDAQVGINW